MDQDSIQWSEIYYKHCDECTGFVKDADFLDQLKDSSSCERKVYSMGLVFVCVADRYFLYFDFRPNIVFG